MKIDNLSIADFKDVSSSEDIERIKFSLMYGDTRVFAVGRKTDEENNCFYYITPKDKRTSKEFYKMIKKKGMTADEAIEIVMIRELEDEPLNE